MTDQERQLIENLVNRVRNFPAPNKDREAEDLIRRGLGANPDALYILVQSVLIQGMALNRANAQLEQLRTQQPPANFLPGGGSQVGGYQASRYQQEPPPSVQYVSAEPPRGRFSDFLHSAAQTAAGVVAGEVAFSALSSLFGHHGGYGLDQGFGGGSSFLGGGETIVNNYYEGGNQHPLEPGLSPDLEDRRFAGTPDTDDSNTSDGFLDDSASDDSASDDSFGSDSSDV